MGGDWSLTRPAEKNSMNLACLECAQRAGTPETLASPSMYGGSGYQCATCRTQWRRSAWGHWQSSTSDSSTSSGSREVSPYWPYG